MDVLHRRPQHTVRYSLLKDVIVSLNVDNDSALLQPGVLLMEPDSLQQTILIYRVGFFPGYARSRTHRS